MSQYLRPATRWAIYLRDDTSCVYCGITLTQILEHRDGNFLTVDHVRLRSKGGGHEPENLVTCCYFCNGERGRKTLTKFAETRGEKESTLRSRVRRRTAKDLEQYRPAAQLALGMVPGFPVQKIVQDHDFLVRSQWSSEDFDIQYWEHLQREELLFCPTCGGPKTHSPRAEPLEPSSYTEDEDIPF